MNLNQTEANLSSLVEIRPLQTADCLFVTISPSPTAKIPAVRMHNGRKVKYVSTYQCLPQHRQYEYCIRVLREAYLPLLDDDTIIVGTYELNEKGHVHLHLILHSKNITQTYPLQLLRRSVADHALSMASRKNLNHHDFMNNIVPIPKCKCKNPEKPEEEKCVCTVMQYMQKDEIQRQYVKHKIPVFNYYVRPNPKAQVDPDLVNLVVSADEATINIIDSSVKLGKWRRRQINRSKNTPIQILK